MKTNWYKWFGYCGLWAIFAETTGFSFGNLWMPCFLGVCISLITMEKK